MRRRFVSHPQKLREKTDFVIWGTEESFDLRAVTMRLFRKIPLLTIRPYFRYANDRRGHEL